MRRSSTLARAVTLVGSMFLLAGCPDAAPATEISAVFEADRVVQRVAQDIEIVAYGGTRGGGVPRENMQTLRFNIADIGGWPVTHTLVPLGGDASRLFQVEGRIFDQSGEAIGYVRATSGYLEERSLVLRLRFYAQCLYVDPCESDSDSCNADGDCVLAVTPPEELPDTPDGGVGPDPGEPACRTSLDCDDLVACTVDTCLDGACVNREDDTLCVAEPGGACDGEAGCQYGPICDATTCQPEGCDETAACVDGVCRRTSKCAVGRECCGTSCVTCNDGSPCTDEACDPAASACVSSDREATCTDGIYCNGLERCVDGACADQPEPCGGSLMCDEDGDACVGCLVDADCAADVVLPPSGPCMPISTDPCQTAGEQMFYRVTTSCTAGSCVEEMTPMGASCVVPRVEGRACGTGEVAWGPCESADRCATMGTRTGRTLIDVCRTGSCVSEGGGGTTSESCPLTPPSDCFPMDSGVMDSGLTDSGTMDSGLGDTGTPDSGLGDTGTPDSGLGDTGTMDSGLGDTGTMDTGTDSGWMDSGFEDSAMPEPDSSTGTDSGSTMDSTTMVEAGTMP